MLLEAPRQRMPAAASSRHRCQPHRPGSAGATTLATLLACAVLLVGAVPSTGAGPAPALRAAGASRTLWFLVPDGSGDFPTIQAAFDSPLVLDGDEIVLADGVYQGPGNSMLDPGEKELIIRSASGIPQRCVLDGEGTARGFWLHGNQTSAMEIRDLTLRNMRSTGACPFCNGAAFLLADSTYLHNGASPLIANCIVRDCWSEETGAGLFANVFSAPIIRDCHFTANEAREGAAICLNTGYADSSVRIIDCFFDANTADRAGGLLDIHAGPQSGEPAVVVEGCIFRNNRALGEPPLRDNKPRAGGAIYFWTTPAAVDHCSLYGNEGTQEAGGIYVDHGSHVTITATIISSSIGAAVACDETSTVDSMACCDLFANSGGDWTDCIAGFAPAFEPSNLSSDPRFCDPEAADFHLQADSPCLPGALCPEGIGALVATCAESGVPGTGFGAEEGLVLRPVPHPFLANGGRIVYRLPPTRRPVRVLLTIHDASGRLVRRLEDGWRTAGEHAVVWDGRDERGQSLPSGSFWVRARAGEATADRSLLLVY